MTTLEQAIEAAAKEVMFYCDLTHEGAIREIITRHLAPVVQQMEEERNAKN